MPPMSRVHARAVFVGGLLMFVASMVPWFSVTAGRGRATAWLVGSVPGWSMAVLGVATLTCGATLAHERASRWRTVVPLVAAVMVGAGAVRALTVPAAAAADAVSVASAERLGLVLEPSEVRISLDRAVEAGRLDAIPAAGPWLALAGAAAASIPLVAGGVVARRRGRSVARA
jgi:hypothetical protein